MTWVETAILCGLSVLALGGLLIAFAAEQGGW